MSITQSCFTYLHTHFPTFKNQINEVSIATGELSVIELVGLCTLLREYENKKISSEYLNSHIRHLFELMKSRMDELTK